MRSRTANRRPGFTLVELMIVVAIIAILMALSTSAVVKTIDWQHRTNTRSELDKFHGETTKQWSATIDNAGAEADKGQYPASVKTLAGDDARRAKVIWIKLRLRQEFPMTYAEALNPGGGVIPPGDLATKYPELRGHTSANDPETESAACLLMALKKKRRGVGMNVEEALGSGFVSDTDGDGFPEIIDSWGTPVRFYRWGCYYSDLDTSAGGTGLYDRDKEDPDHTLMNATWNASQYGSAFHNYVHPIRDASGARRSFYTEPVIVSAGPDKDFGLYPIVSVPWMQVDTSRTSKEANNFYSFKER